jgi:hypothetical protein
MFTKPGSFIACGLMGIILCGAEHASALSCALPELMAPRPQAVDVPTNTLIWCSSEPVNDVSPIVLTDPEGVVVHGTHTRMSSSRYALWVFRPDAALLPSSEYLATCRRDYSDTEWTSPFKTGASAASAPPSVPDISSMDLTAHHGYWGDAYLATFRNVGALDSIIVLDLGGGAALDAEAPSGHVADAESLAFSRDFTVGHGVCGGNWPTANLGASNTVALGAFDLAGQFSGWSDTRSIVLPSSFLTEDPELSPPPVPMPSPPPDVSDVPNTTDAGASAAPPGGADEGANDSDDANDAASQPGADLPVRAGCQIGAAGSSSSSGAAALLGLVLWRRARRGRRSAGR